MAYLIAPSCHGASAGGRIERDLEPVRDVPTVLLWGAQDRVLRSGQTDDVRAKVPDAEVVIREGWDHFPMIEQPEEYADEIAAMATRLAAVG